MREASLTKATDVNWDWSVVDADLLRRKTAQVLHHLERLAWRHDITEAELDANEDLFNSVLMDLQQAIQACIDLAAHVCVDDSLGAPGGPAEAFSLLARAGRIVPELSVRLTGAAGLRNLIVHRYTEIESGRILTVLREDLGDLRRFVQALNS